MDTGPKTRQQRWLALGRVFLVVAPIAAGGFYLGIGGFARTPRQSPKPVALPQLPAPVLEVIDRAGRPKAGGAVTARLAEGERLQLDGWVANQPDGSVEVVAEGWDDHLERLTASLWEGPAGSSVSRVDVRHEPARGNLAGFSILSGAHRGD